LPKNEDGEFELVLGNKQLLSMFFVVVVLLGVFFVMGYIVGRNSAPLANAEPSIARKADTKPLVVDSPAPKATEAAPSPEPSKPLETAVERPAETKPELPKTELPKPEPVKPSPAPKREVAKEEKPRTVPPASNQLVPGQTYLQLVATSKHDADATVEVLRKYGFSALDSEVPEKPGLFRVLVGPIAPGDVNKVKVELQDKGLPGNNAIPKKF
jgi:hypothetical protein